MSIPQESRVWVLNEPPTDRLTEHTFKVETRKTPTEADLQDGQVLVKTLALSNDPAQRTWMDGGIAEDRHYAKPIRKGDAIRAGLIGKVVASKNKDFKADDEIVGSQGSWAEYNVISEPRKAVKLPNESDFLSLSTLGLVGLTAYVGAFGEMKLKKEHTLVVSGAAGAVGAILVQIAKKAVGCKKVIGIAGGKEKCEWVKSIGADDCVDYKDASYGQKLKDLLPDYADVYFDNVGGDILNTMLNLVKRHGYISCCGAISAYNNKEMNLNQWGNVIYNRLTVKGFIVIDHPELFSKGIEDLTKWLKDGTIVNTESETVVDTKFEDIPKTFEKLFTGGNRGKLITKLV